MNPEKTVASGNRADSPEVSVVMPSWNGQATIGGAVASVLRQTGPDWELLVVDDGSTDETTTAVRAIAGEDPRVRILCGPHLGMIAAANRGIRAARGPLIARLDADDEMLPGRLAVQAAALRDNPAWGAVSCRIRFGGDRSAAAGFAAFVDRVNQWLSPGEIRAARFIDLPVPNPSLMVRTSVYQEIGLFNDGPFPEDYEWFLRAVAAGVEFGKVSETLLLWNDSAGRMTRTDPRYRQEAFLQCKGPWLRQAIEAAGAGHRAIWCWGAGRESRKRMAILARWTGPVAGYIDIDPAKFSTKAGSKPVVSPEELPSAKEAFILALVGNRGAGEAIREYLLARQRVEGTDFWICA